MNFHFSLCFGSSFKYLDYLFQIGQASNLPHPPTPTLLHRKMALTAVTVSGSFMFVFV